MPKKPTKAKVKPQLKVKDLKPKKDAKAGRTSYTPYGLK